jgi:chromodomain-helicase-DNA-binding protein 7
MVPPEDYDYTTHEGDWCRYCGARFSSNFTKGPWVKFNFFKILYLCYQYIYNE